MQKNFLQLLWTSVVLTALAACASASTPQPTATPAAPTPSVSTATPAITTAPVATPTSAATNVPAGRVLVLGDISDDPTEVIEGTQPLADYLAEQLKPYGVSEVQIRVVSSAPEMALLLNKRDVDICFDSVYPATLLAEEAHANIILRRWRFGVEKYQSVIFASKASGITQLSDLPGHMVAMDAPYSTSGFMLPAVLMTEQGLKLVGKAAHNDPVAADEVGFVFSYDDENSLQWVLSGLVAAGVTDDYNFDVAFPREAVDQLVVLGRTDYVPRQVVLARPDLEKPLLAAIKQTLIGMDETDAGRAALKPFQTSQFDDFPEGIEQAIKRMQTMMHMVINIPLPPEK